MNEERLREIEAAIEAAPRGGWLPAGTRQDVALLIAALRAAWAENARLVAANINTLPIVWEGRIYLEIGR